MTGLRGAQKPRPGPGLSEDTELSLGSYLALWTHLAQALMHDAGAGRLW